MVSRFLDIVARSLPDLGEHDVRRVAGLLREIRAGHLPEPPGKS